MNIYITGDSSVNPVADSVENSLPASVTLPQYQRLTCIEPDYKTYIPDAGMRRRMSRAVRMGVAAAMQCLQRSDKQPDAIITATGLGCLSDTEKFLKTLIENDEQLLNPTPFIQSTFNTVGAQTAINLNNTNYNMTYVHRGFSFESALLDAMMKINDREAANVLVGTYEEITDTAFDVMERLGFWRHGEICGEGSQFFMLSSQKAPTGNCVLKDATCLLSDDVNGVKQTLLSFLQTNNTHAGEVDVLLSGNNGNNSNYLYYREIERLFEDASIVTYKHLWGDYHTVSSAAFWLAIRFLSHNGIPRYLLAAPKNRKIQKILIYNVFNSKNHSFILLEKE